MKEKYLRKLPEGYKEAGEAPRKVAKILLWILALPYLIPLFYTAFIVGESRNKYQLIGLVVCFLLTIVHEELHRVGFILFAGCRNTRSIFMKKDEQVHCEAEGYFTKTQTALTSVFPFVIFSVIGIILFVLLRGNLRGIVTGFLFTNFFLCIADIVDFFWELTRPKNALFEVPGDKIVVYIKKERQTDEPKE